MFLRPRNKTAVHGVEASWFFNADEVLTSKMFWIQIFSGIIMNDYPEKNKYQWRLLR